LLLLCRYRRQTTFVFLKQRVSAVALNVEKPVVYNAYYIIKKIMSQNFVTNAT
jgi:hypothetical protein